MTTRVLMITLRFHLTHNIILSNLHRYVSRDTARMPARARPAVVAAGGGKSRSELDTSIRNGDSAQVSGVAPLRRSTHSFYESSEVRTLWPATGRLPTIMLTQHPLRAQTQLPTSGVLLKAVVEQKIMRCARIYERLAVSPVFLCALLLALCLQCARIRDVRRC